MTKKEQFKSWYFKNQIEHLKDKKEYYCLNKDKILEISKKRYLKKKAKLLEYTAKYYKENKEKRLNYAKKYRELNHEKITNASVLWNKNKRKSDINFRIKDNLRKRITIAIKNNLKAEKTSILLGSSIKNIRDYIEGLFKEGMSWSNYGDWEIDHKIPCSSFDLSDYNQQLICFNYKNLQPLWKKENRMKSDSIA